MEFDWQFIPGLKLSEALFTEGIHPVLKRHFPDLNYAVARLDHGSDVLGFDTPRSMDHGWGPRATLFLSEGDFERYTSEISALLARELPLEICGIPTNFESERLIDGGLKPVKQGPVRHGIAVTTVNRFFCDYMGFDPVGNISLVDWLTVPSQRLRTLASGAVIYDPEGELNQRRKKLRWYPQDIWLYLMASQWYRIGQEEAFVGRTAEVGDDLGSQVVATRLVFEIMRLSFLQERQHVPYTKWFGSAFGQLKSARILGPVLRAVAQAVTWEEREQHLSMAYSFVATQHNALQLTESLETNVRPFHDRPFQVVDADRFAEALKLQIQGEMVRTLPKGVGAVWQFADSTDVLDEIERCRALGVIYRI